MRRKRLGEKRKIGLERWKGCGEEERHERKRRRRGDFSSFFLCSFLL
jgi:hypothetical protein